MGSIDTSKIKFRVFSKRIGIYECEAYLDEERTCRCKMSGNNYGWTISAWYTEEKYKHNGIGILTMQHLVKHLANTKPRPKSIQYTWDGTNKYVYDWLDKNFNAKCECPLNMQKNNADDDWSSHIYDLDIDKYLKYFKLYEFME